LQYLIVGFYDKDDIPTLELFCLDRLGLSKESSPLPEIVDSKLRTLKRNDVLNVNDAECLFHLFGFLVQDFQEVITLSLGLIIYKPKLSELLFDILPGDLRF
jgi:hypothetical protein